MKLDPASDGWNYVGSPPEGTDARKIVTLEQGDMVWVGIRAWNHRGDYWQNNNEPELATVKAWRDLDEPAKGYWVRGIFYLHQPPIGMKIDFETWILQLKDICKSQDVEDYVRQTGEQCWREMYDDGLSPEDAWSEEVSAARSLG